MDKKFSEVRFTELESMYVASSYVISNNPEEEVMRYMDQWSSENNISEKARRFGFDIPVNEDDRTKGFRGYEYWIVVDKDTAVSDKITLKKIEACKYAVLTITDPFTDPFNSIPSGWKRLVEWVKSNYTKIDYTEQRYWMEEVIEKDGVTYMDIYYPLY